jgi:hypothetical protein
MRLYKPTIDDMLNSRDYQDFKSDRLGNYLFLSDPDRADRIYEASEDGSDGSTHAEIIEDWRAFVDCCDLPERCKDRLRAEIDDCEKWHADHGTLDEQVG